MSCSFTGIFCLKSSGLGNPKIVHVPIHPKLRLGPNPNGPLIVSCDRAITLPETNIDPKNGWLEYYFPIGEAYFQGRLLLVSGRVDTQLFVGVRSVPWVRPLVGDFLELSHRNHLIWIYLFSPGPWQRGCRVEVASTKKDTEGVFFMEVVATIVTW